MRFRSLVVGSAAILIAAGGAKAADLYTPPLEEVTPVATYNWTGVYAGVLGGWNNSRARGKFDYQAELVEAPPDFGPGFSINAQGGSAFHSSGDSGLLGGTVGANLQSGMFVFGVEGDLAWMDKHGHGNDNFTNFVTVTGQPLQQQPGNDLTHRWDMDWFGSGRLRAGITPVDRLLIFGTFGLAAASVDLKTVARIDVQTLTTSKDDTYYGWTAGAGAEYAITHNIRLKADWLYYDLGSASNRTTSVLKDVNIGGPLVDFQVHQRTKLDLTGNTFRGAVILAF